MLRSVLIILFISIFYSSPSLSYELKGNGIAIGDECKEYGPFDGYSTPLKKKGRSYDVCINLTKAKDKVKTTVPKVCLEDKFCNEIHLWISNKTKSKNNVTEFVNKLAPNLCIGEYKIKYNSKIRTKGLLQDIWADNETDVQINCLETQKRWEEEKKQRLIAKQKEEEESLKLEQEAKAQEQLDSQQKKMETCSNYGFEKGTEAFGNCIFKLMELELEYAKLENEKLRLEAQADQAKLNNQVALANSLAAQAQAANQDKALRIQQFGLAMQGLANSLQPAQPLMPKITCNKIGNITNCY